MCIHGFFIFYLVRSNRVFATDFCFVFVMFVLHVRTCLVRGRTLRTVRLWTRVSLTVWPINTNYKVPCAGAH